MISKFPLSARVVAFIVLPLLAFATLADYRLRSALPARVTVLRPGAPAQAKGVRIVRDDHGVPHIRGATDRDVFYAMGYAQAQDRMWQLERQRRIAQGRLSEIFGRGMLKQDAWIRTLGLYRAAQAALPALSDEARDSLQAYADGINAWIASHPVLPPEFIFLGIEPEPWTPVDSLAWIKVFSLNLAGNLDEEIEHYVSGLYMTREQMDFVFNDKGEGQPVTVDGQLATRAQALNGILQTQQLVQRDLKLGGKWLGSNAWAVSGRLSADGRATVANDPHLGLSIPSWWYPVVLDGPGLKSAGMSLVGLPVVVLGHNDDIAWGATSMTADVQDLYFETLDSSQPGRYLHNGRSEALGVRTEEIRIRPDFPSRLRPALKPVRIQVRSTRHGPIITDTDSTLDTIAALRWVALDDGDTTYEALLRLNRARNWQAFQSALALFVSPALNFVYADTGGNIGYVGAGRIPIRRRGQGSLPVPGENDDYEWQGYIPASRMPRSYNPPKGYIVSANNKVVGPEYPYFISNSWAPPGRALRIAQMLEQSKSQTGRVDIGVHERIQMDVMSLPAVRMLDVLRELRASSARQQAALDYLKHWDGQMSADSPAAAIFDVWMRHLAMRLYSERVKVPFNSSGHAAYLDAMFARTSTDDLLRALTRADSPWCGPHPGSVACADELLAALDAALDELSKLKGGDMSDWRWGKVQTALYEHIPFSTIKPLNKLFERRIGTPGSEDTVNIAYSSFRDSEGYLKYSGAGFRQIMRMGPGAIQYLYVNSTGQSGNVMSPYYDDMLVPFERGQYFDLATNADAGQH